MLGPLLYLVLLVWNIMLSFQMYFLLMFGCILLNKSPMYFPNSFILAYLTRTNIIKKSRSFNKKSKRILQIISNINQLLLSQPRLQPTFQVQALHMSCHLINILTLTTLLTSNSLANNHPNHTYVSGDPRIENDISFGSTENQVQPKNDWFVICLQQDRRCKSYTMQKCSLFFTDCCT